MNINISSLLNPKLEFLSLLHSFFNFILVENGTQNQNEPSHEIIALFVLRKLILQTRIHNHPVGLDVMIFGWTLRLLPYFMCANSEGSGETARMRRLA